jgi:single-stranded-DNA-specific exonuclease
VQPNGVATGSGRSVAGVDLGRAVRAAVEAGIATKGGGHAMAAGVTLEASQIERFLAFLSEAPATGFSGLTGGDDLAVDARLTASGAQPSVLAAIERAGPFGSGQPEPVFAFGAHRVVSASAVGNGHVRVKLRSRDGGLIGGIAFRAADQPLGQALLRAQGSDLHVAGTLCLDRWGGGERVELRITDAAATR